MELIVFDLDGTLLNSHSEISTYTRDTLRLLAERDVAYTVATGRTLHAARMIVEGQGFNLPHVYKNGVMIWHPDSERMTHRNVLTANEVQHVMAACAQQQITPFIATLSGDNEHAVFHTPVRNEAERRLLEDYIIGRGLRAATIDDLDPQAQITSVSAIGSKDAVKQVVAIVDNEPHLVAYAGNAVEGLDLYWLDVHHSQASKGGAITVLKQLLGFERVICFGDSDNDLSMFELADESYAPDNAKDYIKDAATAVIGHHDEEGIARFLRERFALGK